MKDLLLFCLVFIALPAFTSGQDIKQDIAKLREDLDNLKKELAAVAQENAVLKEETVPIGTIQAYAGDKVPSDGWMLCDGSELNISEYPLLFKAIGKTWGGSSTKFRVPDLRGRFLRGVDNGANVDPDKDNRRPLFSGGNRGNEVGSYQDDATSLPKKPLSGETSLNGEHSHTYKASWPVGDKALHRTLDDDVLNGQQKDYSTDQSGSHNHTFIIKSGGDTETRPINAAVNWIIKVDSK